MTVSSYDFMEQKKHILVCRKVSKSQQCVYLFFDYINSNTKIKKITTTGDVVFSFKRVMFQVELLLLYETLGSNKRMNILIKSQIPYGISNQREFEPNFEYNV